MTRRRKLLALGGLLGLAAIVAGFWWFVEARPCGRWPR